MLSFALLVMLASAIIIVHEVQTHKHTHTHIQKPEKHTKNEITKYTEKK